MIPHQPFFQMKLKLVITFFLAATATFLYGQQTITSPDGNISVSVTAGDSIALKVSYKGKPVNAIYPQIKAGGRNLVAGISLRHGKTEHHNSEIRPVVPGSRSLIPDVYNQLNLPFSKETGIKIRVYNDGWGYRFYTHLKGTQTIDNEGFALINQPGDSIWFPEETSYLSHSERLYPHLKINEISSGRFCSLPALIHGQGVYTAVSEACIEHFPGIYLKTTGSDVLFTAHPPYPLEEKQTNDRTVVVSKPAPYIAVVEGEREFPWRVFGITDFPGNLVGSDLVYRFGPEQQITETGWIRPGRVAWDWWNDNNISGVPFKSGINTATYKYYIDFAADYGIEYIILDEGWSNPSDLFDINKEMNMEELFSYASEKKVGIILWVLFNTLDRQLDSALDQFVKWGAKGIKVDFMQRDDQKMVEYYWKIARKAAEKKLLVDFHGSYKPDGLRRAYPNVLTREGVKGLENCKWGKEITPAHDLILPFTRMFAGPMDYTPGAMINATQKEFHPVWSKPMSQGTRCHQLALYVVYESPLQMLADNPTHYRKEPEAMLLLKDVPVTWDETLIPEACPGEKIVVMRRKGDNWYIAGLTDWNARDIRFTLPGNAAKWKAQVWEDGPNADRDATDFTYREIQLEPGSVFNAKLSKGGGFVIKLTK